MKSPRSKPRWSASIRGAKALVNDVCHGYSGGVNNGGTVIPKPQVYLVCWDAYFVATPAAVTSMKACITDLVGGSYVDGLNQYGVGRGQLRGAVVIDITKYPPPAALNESQLGSQLVKWLDNGDVPVKPSASDSGLVYLILSPSGTQLSLGGQVGGFCGYHSFATYGPAQTSLVWAVVTHDASDEQNDGDAFVNQISYCISHELVEAFSNPTDAGVFATNGCEIGDLCEQLGTVQFGKWQVEKYWSQVDCACVATGTGAAGHGSVASRATR